jgi:hypothetical protein
MTDTRHRLYAVVLAVTVFFVSWATVAARPWVGAQADPRLAALDARAQRLRTEANVVRLIVARRTAAYEAARTQRLAEIARRSARAVPSTPAAVATPPVRVVTLPPLTVTRTS